MVKKQVEAAVASSLAARGLPMVSGKSDLDVHYYVATTEKWKFVNLPDCLVWRDVEKYPP
ncbi:MAG TPA: hypothetical protein VLM42_10045 [Bryobacteraceae bacterium]|nr:hypothetical protein [Bryobacteraceae bacterium]